MQGRLSALRWPTIIRIVMKRQKPTVEHQDPIRIVQLHGVAAAAPAPAANLTYRKGPLIKAVEVFTIFWGPAWKQTAHADMIGRLNTFFDVILTSALVDELAEYNVPKYPIKHGK